MGGGFGPPLAQRHGHHGPREREVESQDVGVEAGGSLREYDSRNRVSIDFLEGEWEKQEDRREGEDEDEPFDPSYSDEMAAHLCEEKWRRG